MNTSEASQLHLAIRYAVEQHQDQYRKGTGDPYIVHPLRVMAAVQAQPLHVRIAAVLHDTVEDTDATVEGIEFMFGSEVARLVDAVSRRPGETYLEFIHRVVNAGPEAMTIKRADIRDNLSDLSDGASLHRRYMGALMVLDAELAPVTA